MFRFVSHVPHPGETTPTGGEEAQHSLSVTYSALPKNSRNTGGVEGEQRMKRDERQLSFFFIVILWLVCFWFCYDLNGKTNERLGSYQGKIVMDNYSCFVISWDKPLCCNPTPSIFLNFSQKKWWPWPRHIKQSFKIKNRAKPGLLAE